MTDLIKELHKLRGCSAKAEYSLPLAILGSLNSADDPLVDSYHVGRLKRFYKEYKKRQSLQSRLSCDLFSR